MAMTAVPPHAHQGTNRGPQLTQLQIADEPQSWTSGGFTVDARGRVRLGSVSIELIGGSGGVVAWGFDGASGGGTLDGIPLVGSVGDPAPRAPHRNLIRSIDHVVVVTQDSARSISAFTDAGFPPRGSRSTTTNGEPTRQTFFWAGDVIIELVGSSSGRSSAGRSSAGKSSAGRSSAGRASVFGLALVSENLEDCGRELGELLGPPKPAVQAGRRIAGFRGERVGITVPLAVMSPHPRTGGYN